MVGVETMREVTQAVGYHPSTPPLTPPQIQKRDLERGMGKISLMMVANNRWGDYAGRYMASVIANEPSWEDTELVLVDSGSEPAYPESELYKLIRIEHPGHYNYMQCLNTGLRAMTGDWLILGNDDVECTAPYTELITSLDPNGFYGKNVRKKDLTWGAGRVITYVYGWIMVMHRSVFEKVGFFDEYYLHAGFDDIDYSWRAEQLGIPIVEVPELPFVHLDTHRRNKVHGFKMSMIRSKEHFVGKVKAYPPQSPQILKEHQDLGGGKMERLNG